MITLSLLKQMANDDMGTIDSDLFHLEAPLDGQGNPKNGAWIVPRGAPVSRHNVNIQPFDMYFRHTNKNTSMQRAKEFLDYFKAAYEEVCELPPYPPLFSDGYSNVTIEPTDGIEFVGEDDNRKLVFVISGSIRYADA